MAIILTAHTACIHPIPLLQFTRLLHPPKEARHQVRSQEAPLPQRLRHLHRHLHHLRRRRRRRQFQRVPGLKT